MDYAHGKDCSNCGYESGDNLGGACGEEAGGYEQGSNSQASDPSSQYDGTQAASLYDKDSAEKEGGLDSYAAAGEMKARDDADAERQKQDELSKRFGEESDWMKSRDDLEAGTPSRTSLEETLDRAQAYVEQEQAQKRAMQEDDRVERNKSEDEE